MCKYNLQLNLNGLEWQIVCNLRVSCVQFIVFVNRQKQIKVEIAPTQVLNENIFIFWPTLVHYLYSLGLKFVALYASHKCMKISCRKIILSWIFFKIQNFKFKKIYWWMTMYKCEKHHHHTNYLILNCWILINIFFPLLFFFCT